MTHAAAPVPPVEAADPAALVTGLAHAARTAQRDAYDRIVANHDLYCTVCDNNNGNCTVHNTLGLLGIDHQTRPFQPKGYAKDESNPFYRYDPDQCILCGRCVEACQNVQVNETLTIGWEMEQPRVLWDGGKPIGESSCVSCGHCVTVCPCNALIENSMIGEAGLFTGIPLPVWDAAIDVVKGVEASAGLNWYENGHRFKIQAGWATRWGDEFSAADHSASLLVDVMF